jgi:hypothetical protein
MQTGLRWAKMALVMGVGAGVALLAACGGNSNSSGSASVRLLNASSGYSALSVAFDGATASSTQAFGGASAYLTAGSSGASTAISDTSSTSALSTTTRTFSKDSHYTLLAYGSSGALKTDLLEEGVAAAATNVTSLQVLHRAPDAGSVDVYLTGNTDSLDTATALTTSLGVGSNLSYTAVTSGTYRLRVTGAGDKTDLRLDVTGLVLASTQVANLVLTEGVGGVLVNGVLLVQQGTATPLVNTMARLRVVSAVASAASVTAAIGSTTVASAVISPTIGNYTPVTGSTSAPLNLAVNGAVVAAANLALLPGGDYTLLVWGSAAAPQVTLVVDDNRYPTVTGGAKIRLVNATSGTATALTMKADFSAVADTIAQGQASAYANVASSTTMRIDVSSASNPSVYTLTGATITAKGLYTLYVLGDAAAPIAELRKVR